MIQFHGKTINGLENILKTVFELVFIMMAYAEPRSSNQFYFPDFEQLKNYFSQKIFTVATSNSREVEGVSLSSNVTHLKWPIW